MKRIFIAGKYEGELTLPKADIKKLPTKLALAMPVQFIHFQPKLKKQLEQAGKRVILFKSTHGQYPGQMLGCDILALPGDYDAFLYVGDGKFHPTALLYENNKPVYCYNPFINKLEVLDSTYLTKLQQKKKGLLAKFLSSQDIGIITTTKPGQSNFRKAEELRVKLEQSGKNAYIFLADEINFAQLENFNFISSWINTACPRIIEDFNCLNVEDLEKMGL